MIKKDLVIVGGGPAGLAAAVAAFDSGIKDILILEREPVLGGILNQCIHNGFGLHTFKEELTGPEYAARFEVEVKKRNIDFRLGATVIDVSAYKQVTYVSEKDGLVTICAGAVILACGCRERPRGAINIAGDRASGVFSAGTAQKLVNIEGLLPGKSVVVLGSGDIGLIMARRMTLEGAVVKAVVELMPYSSGLNRNIVQCLNDYDIPLYFCHTVVDVKGKNGRVEGVVIAEVDDKLVPKKDTYKEIACDTLLLSVGLLPENELARGAGVELSPVTGGAVVDQSFMTSVDGIFECGNVLHVHDLVDYVSEESTAVGKRAAEFVLNGKMKSDSISICACNGVRYTVPQKIDKNFEGTLTLRMRVSNVFRSVKLVVKGDDEVLFVKPRNIVTPGEMETLLLPAQVVSKLCLAKTISVGLEEAVKV